MKIASFIMNLICIIVWCIAAGLGIYALAVGEEINPISYILACSCCALSYVSHLIKDINNY